MSQRQNASHFLLLCFLSRHRDITRPSIAGEDKSFSHAQKSWPALGNYLAPLQRTSGSFPEVRRSEHEAGNLRLSRAELKGEWSYTSAPCMCVCMGCTRKPLPFPVLLVAIPLYSAQVTAVLALGKAKLQRLRE